MVALITGGVTRHWPRACFGACPARLGNCRLLSEKRIGSRDPAIGTAVLWCTISDNTRRCFGSRTCGSSVRRVEDEYGRIDALINCIGAYHRVPLMEESVEGLARHVRNNLHPVFYLSRAVAPGMIQRGWGSIINFSMVNADQQVGQPFITAHYIAKIGVLCSDALSGQDTCSARHHRQLHLSGIYRNRQRAQEELVAVLSRASPQAIWAARTMPWAPLLSAFR